MYIGDLKIIAFVALICIMPEMYKYEVKMKEYAIEKYLKSEVQRRHGFCLKFISPGMAGVPDRIVLLPNGKIGFAELKAPGKKPRRMQRVVIRQLYLLGCRVAVLDNFKSVEGFIRSLMR